MITNFKGGYIMFATIRIILKEIFKRTLDIILIGSLIIVSLYFVQGSILEQKLHNNTKEITQNWVKNINSDDVIKAKQNKDVNSVIQKKFTSYFDDLSIKYPIVAQGYLFGAELENGSSTSIISNPTNILQNMAQGGLKLGDMYEQPKLIVNAIKIMLDKKEIIFTSHYTDIYGTWLTVLYPIYDKNKKIIAYFGVDFDASSIYKNQLNLLKKTSSMLFIFLFLTIIINTYIYFSKKRLK
jgi:methyl-accepting chemotaxis protein